MGFIIKITRMNLTTYVKFSKTTQKKDKCFVELIICFLNQKNLSFSLIRLDNGRDKGYFINIKLFLSHIKILHADKSGIHI